MRVNIYAEEMTNRVEIVKKGVHTGVRIYLYMPVTNGQLQLKGPFIHHQGDDDSSAVTFWGKQDLRVALEMALTLLNDHLDNREKA